MGLNKSTKRLEDENKMKQLSKRDRELQKRYDKLKKSNDEPVTTIKQAFEIVQPKKTEDGKGKTKQRDAFSWEEYKWRME